MNGAKRFKWEVGYFHKILLAKDFFLYKLAKHSAQSCSSVFRCEIFISSAGFVMIFKYSLKIKITEAALLWSWAEIKNRWKLKSRSVKLFYKHEQKQRVKWTTSKNGRHDCLPSFSPFGNVWDRKPLSLYLFALHRRFRIHMRHATSNL